MHYLVIVLIAATVALFQNCGKYNFSASSSSGANKLSCNDPSCQSGTPTTTPNIMSASQDFPYGPVSNKVDILIIDDNSGSMDQEQKTLGSKFSNITGALSGLDWQIAVTSTDVCPDDNTSNVYPNPANPDPKCLEANAPHARGRFLAPFSTTTYNNAATAFNPNNIIHSTDTNAATLFTQTIQRSGLNSSGKLVIEQGSGDERAIVAANLVVNGSNDATMAKNFFRSGANLAVLILSDEDERSVGGLVPTDPQYRPLEAMDYPSSLIQNVNTTFGGAKSLLVNGIIWRPSDAVCANASVPGNVYSMLINDTGGLMGSICDTGSTYDAELMNISGAIASTASGLTITLNHIPISAPTVTFIPAANAVNYTWMPGSLQITLATRPAAGTTVHVDYQYDANVSKTAALKALTPTGISSVVYPDNDTPVQ